MSRRSPEPAVRAAAEPPLRRPIAVRRLSRKQPLAFDIAPEPGEAEAVARFLGVVALPRLRFRGELMPAGDDGWRIEGRLGAELVQPCVVTLDPVTQVIDETVARGYVPEDAYSPPAELDLDPDAEDDPDPFGNVIDPGQLALESLALAIDPYPRAPGVPPAEYQAAPPGAAPLSEAGLKPFAKLSVLKDKLDEGRG
jgi:uncharacterized metal-binding protein YceD (DUF177 family)